jgi:hypothetical protein
VTVVYTVCNSMCHVPYHARALAATLVCARDQTPDLASHQAGRRVVWPDPRARDCTTSGHTRPQARPKDATFDHLGPTRGVFVLLTRPVAPMLLYHAALPTPCASRAACRRVRVSLCSTQGPAAIPASIANAANLDTPSKRTHLHKPWPWSGPQNHPPFLCRS